MELLKSRGAKALTFFIISLIIILVSINSLIFFKIWERTLDSYLPYRHLESFAYQLNISKAMLKRGYKNNPESINLNLSSEDMQAFQNYYYSSLVEFSFLPDDANEWRKSKINLPGRDEQSIKIKIHGTSLSPVKNSLSAINSFKWNFFNQKTSNDLDISRGGYAFKIKIGSDDPYYNGLRRFNFLSPRDDWASSTNSINKYIQSLGVISSAGNIKKLFINGNEIGPYLVIENIGKELLERRYNITNYAMLKVNDDWNKAHDTSHISSTDFSSYDAEQSGVPETILIAQNQFKRLMKALQKGDLEQVQALIDINNAAKVSALIKLTGTVHPASGDNLKYIYDFATGKFKLSYRLEGPVYHLPSSAPAQFDTQQLHGPRNNKLLDFLLTDRIFKSKRDKYLHEIVEDKDTLINLIISMGKEDAELFSSSRYPTNKFKFQLSNDLRFINHNLNRIKEYLDYSKVYVTHYQDILGKNRIEILHDSYTSSSIESVSSCNDEVFTFMPPLTLYPTKFLRNEIYTDLDSVVTSSIPFQCISNLKIYKNDFTNRLDNRHIYINYAIDQKFYSEKGLYQFGDGLVQEISTRSNQPDKYTLNPGAYFLAEEVIFPSKASLEIKPGVSIKMNPDVSLLVRGPFKAIGRLDQQIQIINNQEKPFGAFAILGDSSSLVPVNIKNFNLSGGSEEVIHGIYFSSQFSVHYGIVSIDSSSFKNSFSDDGLNIKFSSVQIENSIFQNNSADQIDLDFSHGKVTNNKFSFLKDNSKDFSTDGLDVSGSNIFISGNIFSGMTDKGISVGEASDVIIYKNIINKNNNGIAVKDASSVCILGNSFQNNAIDINSYVKKKMYGMPKIFLDDFSGLNIQLENPLSGSSSELIPLSCMEKITSFNKN
jgi:hypothetical protein